MSKLAKVVEVQATDIKGMLQQSGTDWDVERAPAVVATEGVAAGVNHGGFQALYRPDTRTALAFVSKRFQPNSHREQLASLTPLVESGTIIPASVSMWDNGAILAYQFRVPSLEMRIHDTDTVGHLLTLMFSYGFKVSDMAFFAGFRAFCKNQLGKFASLAGEHRVTHRGATISRYADMLGKRIAELTGEAQQRQETMRRMLTAPLPEGRRLVEYVGQVVGATPEEVDQAWVSAPEDLRGTAARIPEVIDCYREDDCGAPGSVWQAYNAVTRYTTHKAGRSDANRLRSTLMGANQPIVTRAWEVAAKLAA